MVDVKMHCVNEMERKEEKREKSREGEAEGNLT